jgi:protein phosphatase
MLMPLNSKPLKVPDSSSANRLQVAVGACSVQGRRRDTNEDCQYVSPNKDLFIVADGVGGHAAGEVASRLAVEVLSLELAQFQAGATDGEIEQQVHKAIERAHCLVLDLASRTPQFHGAKTSVVLAILVHQRLYVTGVGDSRAYLIRGRSIKRLTVDDTWPDLLFDRGEISAYTARHHEMRNLLLATLGMEDFQYTKRVRVLDIDHADRVLLASDGLTDVVGDQQLRQIITGCQDPQQAAEALLQKAISEGGGDDVTCIVFYAERDPHRQGPTAPAFLQRLSALVRGPAPRRVPDRGLNRH